MLEAEASSVLFLCENWDSLWKENALQLKFFKVEIGSL
jgi:hypothetical protein